MAESVISRLAMLVVNEPHVVDDEYSDTMWSVLRKCPKTLWNVTVWLTKRKEKKPSLNVYSCSDGLFEVHKSSRVGGSTILPERDLISEDGGLAKLGVYAFLWAGLIPSGWAFEVPSTFALGLGTSWGCFFSKEISLSCWQMITVPLVCEQPLQGFSCLVSKLCHPCLSQKGLTLGDVCCSTQIFEAWTCVVLQLFQVWQFGNQLIWWHWKCIAYSPSHE